jgi:hypothetical protein
MKSESGKSAGNLWPGAPAGKRAVYQVLRCQGRVITQLNNRLRSSRVLAWLMFRCAKYRSGILLRRPSFPVCSYRVQTPKAARCGGLSRDHQQFRVGTGLQLPGNSRAL